MYKVWEAKCEPISVFHNSVMRRSVNYGNFNVKSSQNAVPLSIETMLTGLLTFS